MINMSKEENRMMFFDMQEHPEHYTDEQVERLLADEDMKEFFHELAMTKMAIRKANPLKIDVEKEWKRFHDEHISGVPSRVFRNRLKIAASIIGAIFLSGITFAAIHSGWFRSSEVDKSQQAKVENAISQETVKSDRVKTDMEAREDTIDLKPMVFEDVELGEVVSQLAAFYQVKVEFENTKSQHIRIFFNWDKMKSLQQNLDILNAFECIQITNSNGTLKVE